MKGVTNFAFSISQKETFLVTGGGNVICSVGHPMPCYLNIYNISEHLQRIEVFYQVTTFK